jgi:hypothetical protein
MPVSVNKIPIHEPKITSKAILPIEELSEEARESRNKPHEEDFKGKCHRRLVTFTRPTKKSAQHVFSSFSTDITSEAERDFSEEPSSNSSDVYSSGTEDEYCENIFLTLLLCIYCT